MFYAIICTNTLHINSASASFLNSLDLNNPQDSSILIVFTYVCKLLHLKHRSEFMYININIYIFQSMDSKMIFLNPNCLVRWADLKLMHLYVSYFKVFRDKEILLSLNGWNGNGNSAGSRQQLNLFGSFGTVQVQSEAQNYIRSK